ncbi:MAG: two-component system response regulator [Rhizobium sp.]|nr:two-component system response regulator [Rhizobium sp.]
MSSNAVQSGKSLNILLVEDDDGDAKAVQRAFAKAKIANPIVRAIDGVEALEMLKGENGRTRLISPFILLIDLNMPRMNGIQLVKALRDDEDLKHSIAFMLTTSKREEDKIAAYDLNVAGYIVKETAGADFANLVALMDYYWRVVEMP